jgi:hypothetical protein
MMKLGTENRTKLIAAVALAVLAIVLFARMLMGPGDSTPASTVSPPSATPAAIPAKKTSTRGKNSAKKASKAPSSLDPELRYDWLQASEDTKYEGAGRNIFKAQAEIPQIVQKVNTEGTEADKGPPPPPPPPPINLKFFGFANKPGEAKRIFLSQGEDVFIASEGDTVDRRYKVMRISPTSVEIEDEMNNNRQSIPLTQG